MSRKHLKIYLIVSLIHFGLVLLWTYWFRYSLESPVIFFIMTIIFSHIFFWFSAYAPRLTYVSAIEKGKREESMRMSRYVIFMWFIGLGIAALFSLISPILNGEIEKAILFFTPAAGSFGAFLCFKHINEALNQTT